MKKGVLLAFLMLLCGSQQAGAAEQFSDMYKSYPDLAANPDKYVEKEVVFEGEVVELNNTDDSRPYFKIAIDPEDKASGIWSAMLFSLGSGKSISLGDRVGVYGFYAPFEDGVTSIGLNDSGFHILAVCVVNFSTSEHFSFGGVHHCENWRRGE